MDEDDLSPAFYVFTVGALVGCCVAILAYLLITF